MREIFTYLLAIRTVYQLNSQSMGWPDMQNATRDPQFVGKKESHGISHGVMGAMGASQIQLLEFDKGSFYNQTNWIAE